MKQLACVVFFIPAVLVGSTAISMGAEGPANKNFDSSIEGWVNDATAPLEWDSTKDVASAPASGSIRISNQRVDSEGLGLGANSECFTVAPGARYDWSVSALLGSDAVAGDSAGLWLRIYTDLNCSRSAGNLQAEPGRTLNGWHTIKDSRVMRSDVQSGRLFLATTKARQGGTLTVNFDRLFFHRVWPVPSLGTVARSALAGGLLALGLLLARKAKPARR